MVSDDRAQLLLIGSVLIALTIVASVVLLNSVYTSEGLRTDDIQTSSQDASVHQKVLKKALREHFRHTRIENKNGEPVPFAYPATDLRQNTTNISRAYGALQSQQAGGSIRLRVTNITNGSVVFQTDETRQFVNQTGYEDWQIYDNVDAENLTRVNMTITSVSGNNATFKANTTAGTSWHLNVSDDDIYVNGVSGSRRLCNPSGSITGVRIDLIAGKGRPVVDVAGRSSPLRCDSIDFASNLGGYGLYVLDGNRITGEYVITTKGTVDTSNTGGIINQPFERQNKRAINVEYELEYFNDGISYVSTFKLYEETDR